MIQDAAAKCRFCGEWLDPSQRPAWSGDAGASQTGLPQPSPGASPAVVPDPAGEEDTAAARSRRTQFMKPGAEGPAPAPSNGSGMFGADHGGGWTPPVWSNGAPTPPPGPPAPGPGSPLEIVDVTGGTLTSLDDLVADDEPPSPRSAGLHPVVGGGADSEESGMVVPVMQSHLGATRQEIAARLARAEPVAPPEPTPAPTATPAPTEPAPDPFDRTVRQGSVTQLAAPAEPPPPAAPPPEPVAAPEPRPDPVPTDPAPVPAPASRADALAASFLGDDDEYDEGDDDVGFDAGASRQPLPWKSLGIAAGVLAGACLVAFAIINTGPPEDTPSLSEALSQVGQAPELPGQDPSAADAEAQAPVEIAGGQPVVPEEAAATGGALPGPVTADEAAPAPTPPAEAAPPADDPALTKRVDAARQDYKQGKLKAARKSLEEVLGDHPKHPQGLLLMAQVQLEQGQTDESLATATSCTKIAPDLADCWLTLGVLHQAKSQKDQALTAYQKYLELAPEGLYARDAKVQVKRLGG